MEETLKLILDKLNSIDTKVNTIDTKVNALDEEQKNMAKRLDKIDVAIEHCIQPKIDALFDGYKQNTESINNIKVAMNKLVANQEHQDVEIKIIHTKVN